MAAPTWVQVWVGWLGAINLAALAASNAASLAIDTVDVARYALGDGALV